MGSWRNLVFLSHILIHLVGLIISQPDFVFKDCGYGFGNYTTSSMYQTNLNTLLSSLSSNIDSYGFYNSSSGENVDRVNAIVLCRGDVDLDTCRGCINNATSKITQDCPNSKEAIGWYDLCMLRYSNESIEGKVKNSPPHCAGNTFNEALRTLLNRLNSQASSGTLRKFATGNETGPDNRTIYGAMQCTPDLSEQDCSFCLQTIMTDIPSCIADSEGGRVDVPSCNLRFDNVPFFSQIPADSPPETLSSSHILINVVGLSISQPDFVFVDCEGWFGNYTTNSTYQRNLNTLLSSLSSNTNSFGFYSSSLGENQDTVNAMVLCRGDIDLDSCHSCINNATSKITQDCPKSKEAIGWYDLCMVRYSNESINGKANASGYCSWNSLNMFSVDHFNQSLTTLFDRLISQAASGGTLQKFAMGNVSGPDDQTIYGFVQCTPDLSKQNCSYCLGVMMADIQSCKLNEWEGGRVDARSCSLRFETVPFLDEIPADSPPLPGRYVNRNRTVIMIVVSALASGVALIILIFILLWKWKQRKPRDEVLVSEAGDKISTVESLQYNFVTISNATDNFCDENLLGKGGFGAVYKGRLKNGHEIAVKRLSMNSGQGDVEFKNEAMLVARLQHRNLVRLLGFCLEGKERLLIYEFVTNSSLDQSIFDPIKRAELDWDRRYKIIGGIARGLLYLHEDSRLRIIHRDLKASNVLLDAEMNPKISDFGMARMFALDETEGNTNRIVGTYGYMAPEYAMHGHFSIKSDVFSFGVLVLEIVAGQKNSCFRNGENVEDLLSYAWKSWLEGKGSNLIDPTLEANSDSISEIERCIHIGLLCVQENIADRPTMASVVHMLKTSSLTLSMPSEPAFFLHSSIGPQKPVLHEFDSTVESNHSKPKSACLSVDDASITGCYPR